MIRLRPPSAGPPRVGQRVVTDFDQKHRDVVRRITSVQRDGAFGSGWRINMNDGGRCPTCDRPHAHWIRNVDGDWARPAPRKGRKKG